MTPTIPPFFSKVALLSLSFGLGVLLMFNSGCSTSSNPTPTFDAAKQAAVDDSLLNAWFVASGLKDSVRKTSGGVYYRKTRLSPDSILLDSMVANTDTALLRNGRIIFLRYKGTLLNGNEFDNNLFDARPLIFTLGSSSYIAGLNEGLLQFRNYEEGYLYIPSGLGYGNFSRPKIPANSCLAFYVRILNAE